MDTRIKEILKDLAALDPAFKDERAVRPLVEHLLALAPRGGMDDSFKSRLRRELIATASALPSRPMSAAQFFASWGNVVYAGAGALAVLLVLFGVFYSPGLLAPSSGVSVVAVRERAFGDLATQGALGMGASAMKGGAESAPTPEGDIAVRSVAPSMAFGMGGGTGAGGPIDMPSPLIYPAPEVPRIDFVYRGAFPEIGDTVDVLRRVKPEVAAGGAVTTLRRFAMGLLDLGEFSGARVESFALSENEPYGYTVYVNPAEGTVSIGQNWRQWPQFIDGPTMGEGMALPPDAELIALADAFLDEYDIDRNGYGDPVVQKAWSMDPLALEKSIMPAYVQEVPIIYPYLVNGEPIFDEGGNPTGLYVGVNVKEKRVSNVSGLMTRRYESSAYAAERDVERLLGYAEGRYWYGEGARTVTVEVDAPTKGYVTTWTWNGSEGSEVVVPALIFPIPENLNIPNMYFPKNLVVPLAKELIDRNMGGPIRIMSDSIEVMSPPSQ